MVASNGWTHLVPQLHLLSPQCWEAGASVAYNFIISASTHTVTRWVRTVYISLIRDGDRLKYRVVLVGGQKIFDSDPAIILELVLYPSQIFIFVCEKFFSLHSDRTPITRERTNVVKMYCLPIDSCGMWRISVMWFVVPPPSWLPSPPVFFFDTEL